MTTIETVCAIITKGYRESRYSLPASLQEAGLLCVRGELFKRLFDVLFSFIVCCCLLPFIPIIALIIKIQSPGPVFFVQERTGIDGKTFRCFKFRSMRLNGECDTCQCVNGDSRIFPFGLFMRRTNIDELPQFFNVLRGDMSIVGSRPHMLYHTDMYSKLIPNYKQRLACLPGITGLAQVSGYRGETRELWQMAGRVRLDIFYIKHWSPALDLRIILKTVKTVFVPDEKAY